MRGRTFSVYPCPLHCHYNTHTQPFNGLLSGTTRVGRYQKKHSPTDTHPDDRTSFIIFLHLQQSTASSLFSLRACQSSRTTSLQVLSGSTLDLILHASPPNHRHPFAAHAHTDAARSAATPVPCHPHPVSLSAPYPTPHIHLTTLISFHYNRKNNFANCVIPACNTNKVSNVIMRFVL